MVVCQTQLYILKTKKWATCFGFWLSHYQAVYRNEKDKILQHWLLNIEAGVSNLLCQLILI